ncbi:MAG: hypothetical protein ACWA5A_13455 [Marinibacterium sp.]
MRAAALSVLVLAAFWGAAQAAVYLNAGWFGILVLALAAPLTLAGAYGAAIRRAHWLVVLDRRGWVFRWLSGPVLRVSVQFLLAVGLATVTLVRLMGTQGPDWLLAALAAVLVPPAAAFWRRLADPQIAPAFRLAARLRAGRVIAACLALTAYAVSLRFLPGADHTVQPAGPFRSVLIEQIVALGGQWRLLQDFALGRLSELGDWGRWAAWAVLLAGNLALLWAATGLVAAFSLPRAARWTAFARAGEATPARADLAWIAAVLTVVTGFFLIPVLAAGEQVLRGLPSEQRPSRIFVTEVEEIGGRFFEPGTIAELGSHLMSARAARVPAAAAELQAAIDAGFDRMTQNIDPVLDWYYSLPAEYARIGHLLIGDLEAQFAQGLEARLFAGDPFALLEQAMQQIDSANAAAATEIESQLRDIAAARQISLSPEQPVRIVGRARAPGLIDLTGADLADGLSDRLRRRLAVSAGGSGLAAAMGAAILGKVASKGVTKLAVKALSKVAVAKTAGGAAGAGIGSVLGGVLGSAVPGLGTALGAAVGGALGGVALGLGVDALLLELEETLHREDLRAALVAALADARADAHEMIGH